MTGINGSVAAVERLRVLSLDLGRVETWTRDGDTGFACPIGNNDAYIGTDEVWCDCAHDPADLERSLHYLVRELPNRCTESKSAFGHRQDCQKCLRWSEGMRLATRELSQMFHTAPDLDLQIQRQELTEYVRTVGRERAEERRARELSAGDTSMRVSGGYLFDLPLVAPIWGTAPHILSAVGQGWMLAGADGTGKTSEACQYAKARLGMIPAMWDMPVVPLPPDRSVYYLAMDRPRQFMEAFMRGVGPEMREMLDRRLFVHRGPPPYQLSSPTGQAWLLDEVEETRAGTVVLDSRKDLGSTVDPITVAGVARAIQLLVSADIDVLVLAHPTKFRRNGPPRLEDISGLRDVFSGLGSVVIFDGRAGSADIGVHHVKPIREILPPFKIRRDHATGCSEVTGGIVVKGKGKDGELHEGRMPVNAREVPALACIDANGGSAPAASLRAVLKSDNLTRDLKELVDAGVVEHNGKRSTQSGYRRGPKAPPPPDLA